MTLQIKVNKKEEGVFVISCYGSIDSITYMELEREISLVEKNYPKAVIIDMQGVTYVSSMGISAVVKAKKELEEKKAFFALINLQPQVKKVFDIIKSLAGSHIFKSIEEADAYLFNIQRQEIEKNHPKV